jgi:hypothetical protein
MRRLAAVLLLVAAACSKSDSPTNPASASLAGTFALRTIDGSALPYTMQSGTTSMTITSDALTVADGGTWSESGAYRQTSNGTTSNQTIADGGTWVRSGASVTFTSTMQNPGATAYSGSFTGSGFGMSDGVHTFAFTK